MQVQQMVSSRALEQILDQISTIALQIQQGKGFEAIVQWAIANTLTLLDAERVWLCRVLSPQTAEIAFEATCLDVGSRVGQRIYDPSLTTAWGMAFSNEGMAQLSGSHPTPCKVQGLQEGGTAPIDLSVPIWHQNKLWGLLTAHRSNANLWHPLDAQLLQQTAIHLSLAIPAPLPALGLMNSPLLTAINTGVDAAVDAGVRAGMDAGMDAAASASLDAGTDAGMDAAVNVVALLGQDSTKKLSELELVEDTNFWFRQMFHSAPVGMLLADVAGRCIEVNERWCALTQRSAAEVLGNSWIQAVHPGDRPHVLATWNALIQQGHECSLEYRIQRPDGASHWVLGHGAPLRAAGGVRGYIVALSDISARKQHEDLIYSVAKDVLATTGDAFFRALVQHLSQHLDMDEVLIGELIPATPDQVRIIAGISHGQPLDGMIYDIQRTPFAANLNQGYCFYPATIQQQFPGARELQPMGCNGYVRMPLTNAAGTVIGLIGVVGEGAIAPSPFLEEMLALFSGRAAAELEHRQTDAHLRRYERITSATPDCVSLIDRHYIYQVVNQTYLEWNQKAATDIVGHSVSDLLGSEFFETTCKPYFDRCLAGESPVIVEAWLHYRDGHDRYTRAIYAPYTGPDGSISGVVVNVHDLTHLKQAEAALQISQHHYQMLVENSPDIIERFDTNFRHLYVSPNLVALTGIPSEVFLGKTCRELGLPDAMVTDWEAAVETLLGTGQKQLIEFETPTLQGLRSFEMAIVPERRADQTLQSILCISRDVTDRKQAEASLRHSEERYRLVVSTMAEGIVLQRADGQITAANQSAEAILGLTAEQLMGRTSTDLDWRTITEDGAPFPGDAHPAMVTLRTGKPQFSITMGICKRPNHITWISINSQPLFLDGAPLPDAVVTSFADITELKQTELMLRQQTARERLLTEIVQHIRQTLDLNIILKTTVAEVRRFLQTDRVLIYRFTPDMSGSVITESLGEGWSSILNIHVADTCFGAGEPHYLPGKIWVTPNVKIAGHSPCHLQWLTQLQVQAKLVVPLWQGNILWGLLAAHHCSSPRDWQPQDQELMRQLATQLEIAIQQSELYEQVQSLNLGLELQVKERTAQLQQSLDFEALLKRITDQVRDSLDEQQILRSVVRELAIALHASRCHTSLYSADHTLSTIQYEYAEGEVCSKLTSCAIADSTDPHLYTQLFQERYCHFSLIGQNPRQPHDPSQTILACPIFDDQGLLGDLWLFKPADLVFSEPEIRLVQQVATQCAIALRQSRLYQAAQAQVLELERLNQLKDDFLSTVSHELRTPVASITMTTQLLVQSLEKAELLGSETHATINRYLKTLTEEGQREISLINDLLDLTRIEADTEPVQISALVLQFFIPHIGEPFLERTQRQGQRLVFEIADALPAFTTDLFYLERILTELLQNACKYTPPGETITVSAQTEAGFLEIRVSNSGVEIPPEERDRIFDKFYRIPNNDPWKYGGTGLGLALVKKFVERLKGTIQVESGHQQTTFILRF